MLPQTEEVVGMTEFHYLFLEPMLVRLRQQEAEVFLLDTLEERKMEVFISQRKRVKEL
jgi:hypothetical protein